MINEIGHDGSEIVWPTVPEPYCRRSFHIQEIILNCYHRKIWVTPLEYHPVIGNRLDPNVISVYTYITAEYSRNGKFFMPSAPGVLVGELNNGKGYHASAWDGREFIDSLAYRHGFSNHHTFYLVGRFD